MCLFPARIHATDFPLQSNESNEYPLSCPLKNHTADAQTQHPHLIVYLIFVLEFFGVETYLQHVSLFNAASKWRWSRSFTMNLIHFDTAENQFFSKSIFTFIAARARPTIIEKENSRDFAFALLIKRPFYSLHYLIEKKKFTIHAMKLKAQKNERWLSKVLNLNAFNTMQAR